ncbi:MAG: Gfo/Idh/MocA family oxidoreductase [Acidobacteria bacterium]|nr:Gfo/Idh/MocA family oxidoreductase [Acidobacteriota bacterium]MBI3656691.1 Gfo/Idh/MocA family oxidoreductase [Acidobacteriota bacterium]
MNRRNFLIQSTQATAAGVIGLNVMGRKILGANDTLRVAIVGVKGRGGDHINGFRSLPNVEIAAFCDVDARELDNRLQQMKSKGLRLPKIYGDIRKLLDDKDIDVISVATPNHWHSLMGIWACQAGKDVYLEKPCSHNVWEGRKLVEAVNKYKRIVQHGTQSRSAPAAQEAMEKLHDGLIGDIYMARAVVFKWRNTIGRAPIEPVPPGVDYDLWLGPAPKRPFSRNRFHYNWHWHWDYGNGDIGNQGTHEMDLARWGLGVKLPEKVYSMGGHFMFDDDQQTPNTQISTFEFNNQGKKQILVFEVRHWITNTEAEIGVGKARGRRNPTEAPQDLMLSSPGTPRKPTVQSTDLPAAGLGVGGPAWVGNIWYGSKGYLVMDGYSKYYSFLGQAQAPGPERSETGDHYANFVRAVRERNPKLLNGPIEEGHYSTALVHLANISYRLGRSLRFDPKIEGFINDNEADKMLRREYRKPFVVPEKV